MLFLADLEITTGQYEKALKTINLAKNSFKEGPFNYNDKLHYNRTYLKYYKSKADWQNVAKYQEIVHNIEKEDLLEDQKGAVSQLNIAYETEKKDSQLGKQKTVIVKQSQFIWGIGGLSLVAFGLSFVFFKLYQKNKKVSRKNEVLIKEQNHRIKNNLQSISSLLNLQSNRMADSDAKSAVDESKLRVEAMANLHHKLYDGDNLAVVDLAEFAEEIVESVLQTLGYEYIKSNIDIKSIHLAADQTLSVGLIINELVTNACKYAFKDNEQPSLSIKANFENEEYVIEVTDNGKKLDNLTQLNATQELQKSFGMRLVQTQVIQLQGSYCFFYKNGTQFVMRFRPIMANV
jgi:two-component system, sensor histidine kinase PdtaS